MWRLISVLETEFQPKMERVKMEKSFESQESKFTSVNNWASNIKPFSFTTAHTWIFGCAKRHCWVLILIHCWDTEFWRSVDLANALSTSAWEPQGHQPSGGCSAQGSCLCFHQHLSFWAVSVLGHCSVFYGTEQRVQSFCALKCCWNFGAQMKAFNISQDTKLLCYWKIIC